MSIEILDSGACKAMGVADTLANVLTANTAGIRRVISMGSNGRVRLELEEGIGQAELVALATALPGQPGITVVVEWIDTFTIELQSYEADGIAAAAVVRFAFFRIGGLGQPAIVPSIPDPLAILGAGNIVGWWDAQDSTIVAGHASAAADRSGNGRNLAQATAIQRFAVGPGVHGLAAWIADGSAQSLFATGLPPVLGDKSALFLVAQADPTVAAFATAAALSNAAITQVPIDIGYVLGQYFGQLNATGGGGAWLTAIAAGPAAHVFELLSGAGAASMRVDGAVIPPAAGTTGGIAVTSPRFELGAGSVAVAAGQVPWTGKIYEALLTGPTELTAPEIAALQAYFFAKYL